MDTFSRREFLKKASAGVAAALVSSRAATGVGLQIRPGSATERVVLGNSGVEVPFLAYGTGVHGYNKQSELTRLGEQRDLSLLSYAHERDMTFLDMADTYGTHFLGRQALKSMPREKATVMTKFWNGTGPWEHPKGFAAKELDRFRKELETEYLDIGLLHRQIETEWPAHSARLRDELSDLKEQGVIKALGVSCHDFSAMEVAASEPWVDVMLARINHRGGSSFSCDNTVDEIARVLKTAKENGKGIIGMKIFGVGKLTEESDRNASLRYVIDNGLVDAMTIGMLDESEIDDNLTRIGQVLNG